MPAARIHRAGPADAAVMAAIHATCFSQGWDEAAMSQFVVAPSVLCLIGAVPPALDAPAGLLIARRAADEAELLTIGVAPSQRRAGLGRALLAHALAELSASGATQLFLEVDEGNGAAVALYRELGAERVGHREGYYESGADAAIFSLALCHPHSDDGRTAR
jgi:ribosomal-protein-alanine N-acetyltransferase